MPATEPNARVITPYQIKKLGWIPDLPDQRDHLYAAPLAALGPLPSSIDLRQQCPEIYDQGQLGSCTANAIAAAIEFDQMKQQLPKEFLPSRLFIYYNERVIEGTVGSDSGAQIRDGIKSVNHQGACPESEWPYDITKFADLPPKQAYDDALLDRAVSYQRVARDLTQMKGCLASGYPFVFGFTVYDSFMSQDVATTGQAPMPGPNEQQVGGHAVMAVGYDDTQQRFIVRNSWGAGWGMAGYFTMPYAYLIQPGLASDLWTIRVVSEQS
jgi:C1A family cysteine protease